MLPLLQTAVMTKKILCIGHEPETIALAKWILGRAGFQVFGAIGASSGLEAVRQNKPDVVLLDLMMPGMDGWEAYRQIKAQEGAKDTSIILITARAQSIDLVLGQQIAGVYDYVTKPLMPRQLVETVENALVKQEDAHQSGQIEELKAALSVALEKLSELEDPDSETSRATYYVRTATSGLIDNLRSHLPLIKQSLDLLTGRARPGAKSPPVLDRAQEHHWGSLLMVNTLKELGLELKFQPQRTAARDLLLQAATIVQRRVAPPIMVKGPKASRGPAIECDPVQIRVALMHLLRYVGCAVQAQGQITTEADKIGSDIFYVICGEPASQERNLGVEHLCRRIAERHGGALEIFFLEAHESEKCGLEVLMSIPQSPRWLRASAITKDIEDADRLTELLAQTRGRIQALSSTRPPADDNELLATVRSLTLGYALELAEELAALQGALADYLVTPILGEGSISRLQRMSHHARLAGLLVDTYHLVIQPPTPSQQAVRLRPIVQEIAQLVILTEATNIDVDLQIPVGLALKADPALLESLLFNLFTNSLGAMPDGGRLIVRASTEGKDVLIEVEDTGSGIDDGNLAHLFQLGFTTRGHGFGLGMTAISRIVQTHGGQIAVESAPGQGTLVTINLPISGVEHSE